MLLLGAGAALSFYFTSRFWGNDECRGFLPVGLLVLGISYLVQNVANFYTVYKYASEYGKYGQFQQHRGERSIWQVTWHFLCYDFFMCFFIFYQLFAFIWACVYTSYSYANTRKCVGM